MEIMVMGRSGLGIKLGRCAWIIVVCLGHIVGRRRRGRVASCCSVVGQVINRRAVGVRVG